ncbi:peptidase S28 [Lenzites betulinus]|nr:peptidase S28 [Lenzites betulinus]
MPSPLGAGIFRLAGAVAFLLLELAGTDAQMRPSNPVWVKLGAMTAKGAQAKRADAPSFPLYTFTQPLDHFHDTGYTFEQRYWVSDRHYMPGGPVIVFEGGEGPGDERLPILDTGIMDILANATNGLAIVLEHRYYGESIPVLNFTTDSLRWLNNDQAAADSANFIDNVTFSGIPGDLTAPGTPWIYYGGSYGGARAAHMRVLYPDLVFGAISSSGVVHATIDDWRYMDIIRQSAPAACMAQVEKVVDEVDSFLASPNPATRHAIKSVFGVPNITYDPDFASLLAEPLAEWQNNNWDPAVGDDFFAVEFCDVLGMPDDHMVHTAQGITVSNATINYAKVIKKNYVAPCSPPATQDDCFGTVTSPEMYAATDLSQTWRAWQFQVCTQWGFFPTPPPDPAIPRIVSKLLTVDYAELTCKLAFAPGRYFTVPQRPDVASVDKLGGYNIAYDRLAIIDGQYDPWRGDTPHSPAAHPRADTTLRPFKLIPKAVHHYDENGLADHSQEPPEIQAIHHQEVEFVKAWLKDFKAPKA